MAGIVGGEIMILIITIGVCVLFVTLAVFLFGAKIQNERHLSRKIQELDEDFLATINGTDEQRKAFMEKYSSPGWQERMKS